LHNDGGDPAAWNQCQIWIEDRYNRRRRGAGRTLTGQVLSPQTVRKLACDASIIPMVLGSQSQPLDVGRTKRLVTQPSSPPCGRATKDAPSPPAAGHPNGPTRII